VGGSYLDIEDRRLFKIFLRLIKVQKINMNMLLNYSLNYYYTMILSNYLVKYFLHSALIKAKIWMDRESCTCHAHFASI
jgi:hypothetical protein